MNQEDPVIYPKIHLIFLEWLEEEEQKQQEPAPAGKQKTITSYKETMKRFSEDKEGGRAKAS